MNELTKREREILEQIKKVKNLRNVSIDNLCKVLKVGYSTIYSIIKKANFVGYKDMINKLSTKPIRSDISSEELLQIDYKNLTDSFFNQFDFNKLDEFLELCRNAKNIVFLGKSHSNILAEKYSLDFNRLGFNSFAFKNNLDEIMLQINNMSQDNLVVAITSSGNTDWIETAVHSLSMRKIPYVLITGMNNPKLAAGASLNIVLPTRQNQLLDSRVSNFIPYLLFLDVIWSKSN
jgi:DNA-binding MurR/RpiR family transcriptional regulator